MTQDVVESIVVGDCGRGVGGAVGFETGRDGLVPFAGGVVAEEVELLGVVCPGERPYAEFDATLLF